MSASTNNEQEIRQRNSTSKSKSNDENDDNKSEETEVITLPTSVEPFSSSEPGPLTKAKMASLLIVLFGVFMDFMGMSLIQPILPFYAEDFGASPAELGYLYSSYSLMSLLASLFMGVGSDRFGRKPMVIFSLFGTMVGYLSTALAQNYGQLLAFRFLTGFFGSSSPIAFACIADMVPKRDRSKWIASVASMLTVAFIIGPALGGGLSDFGLTVPFFAASGMGLFGMLIAIFLMKESNPAILRKRYEKNKKKTDSKKQIESNLTSDDKQEEMAKIVPATTPDPDNENLEEMDKIEVVNKKAQKDESSEEAVDTSIPATIWMLCLTQICTGFGSSVYMSMMTLYIIDNFGLAPVSVGYITLTTACIATFANFGFLAGSKFVGMYMCSILSMLWFAAALCLAPNMNNLWVFLAVVCFGIGIGFGTLISAYNAMAMAEANVKTRGRIAGIVSASSSVANIFGPVLHGSLYAIDQSYPFYTGAGFCGVGVLLTLFMLIKWPHIRQVGKAKKATDDMEIPMIDAETWVYTADKPTKKDYMKLGKSLGLMLSQKNYLWVKYFDQVMKYLDVVAPPLRVDTFRTYNDDINHMVAAAKNTRDEFEDWAISHHGVHG